MPRVSFTLNGEPVGADYEEGQHLLELLRIGFGVTAAKNGCSQGICGSCTVLVDGRPALACQKKPEHVAGRKVTTLEGLPPQAREALARALVREGAIQCGFCTPGIVVRAYSLLERGRGRDRAAIARALDSHVCRCTGYLRIVDAIESAATARETGEPIGDGGPRRPVTIVRGGGRERVVAGGGGVGDMAPRYRGIDHALGAKPFIADMKVPGMLHAALVLAEHPRARVLAIDGLAALARPGVSRVLTAADVPGQRLVGQVVQDWPVLVAVGETTRCVGDVIAVVVADTQHHARLGAAAVDVGYEVFEPLVDPFAALVRGAPRLHESGNVLEVCAYARGDVTEALAGSAHVVEERFTTQRIEHAFLEPEACLAVPGDGGLTVYSPGQGVHDDQRQIAAVLGLPPERITVELVATGGAFGGKEDLSVQAHTALAAHLTGRPVRCVLTREQSLLMHPKRHPLTMDYAVGCDREGRLTAVRARIVGDSGAYASVGGKVLERAAGHACGPYRVPNVDVEATAVYTNNPPSGAMRGFGVPQTAFAIEGCLDRLAERVGIDRFAIRERNVLRPGDRFATGQVMTASCGAAQTLEAVRETFLNARHAGIACGIKNTGIGNGLNDTGRVLIRVHPGPRLEVVTGFTEMGQGLFTILRQVVAHETGVDPALIDVATRSELAVVSGMTTASRATALSTVAAQRAAAELSRALADRGWTGPHAPRESGPAAPRRRAPLEANTDRLRSALEGLVGSEYRGEFVCDFTVAPGTRVDNPVTHVTFGYATQVVILDDEGRIEKLVAAHDVGRAINPLACAGQIEGAIHMGLGFALSEDFPCHDGRPDSLQFKDLGIVKASEMPDVEVLLVEVPDDVGGYGSKGVGEIGLVPTAAAVASALSAFDGTHRTTLPMRDAARRTLGRRASRGEGGGATSP